MKTKTFFVLILIIGTVCFYSCKKDKDNGDDKTKDPSSANNYTTVVISHYGYDFSAAKRDTTAFPNSTNDGDVVSWNPENYSCTNYLSNQQYVWLRNSGAGTVNFTKDYGVVDVSTITTVPTAWDTGCAILPLLPEHVIVAKCLDGYVKFKVISADTSNNWTANITYLFSTTNTFAY
ncbi:MAG: hypothetical protein PHD97_05935 [Bacteroidales bacterium]|nr:hypothetical protein [Bacteroidales bacterium]